MVGRFPLRRRAGAISAPLQSPELRRVGIITPRRPVFYLADAPATCWVECRRPPGPFSIARFAIKSPLRILDLCEPDELDKGLAAMLFSSLMSAPSENKGWDQPQIHHHSLCCRLRPIRIGGRDPVPINTFWGRQQSCNTRCRASREPGKFGREVSVLPPTEEIVLFSFWITRYSEKADLSGQQGWTASSHKRAQHSPSGS